LVFAHVPAIVFLLSTPAEYPPIPLFATTLLAWNDDGMGLFASALRLPGMPLFRYFLQVPNM